MVSSLNFGFLVVDFHSPPTQVVFLLQMHLFGLVLLNIVQ